jgi:DNA-binding PadR family transcriptional regulator
MIRALILYILSIRSTHGYDIQRFIEINGMDKLMVWINGLGFSQVPYITR